MENKAPEHVSVSRGLLALSPMAVFLLSYVAVSLYIGDFYKMPVAVALALASVWAVLLCRRIPLLERIEIFSRAAGHSNILYMIWVFVLAGAFANLARATGAVDATVQITLSAFPLRFVVPTLFVAACFISMAVGTSVGTVVALTPLAAEIAHTSGASTAFFVAAVLGGAFFGDNLSFISDTTIASTRTQGCAMADKFRANLWICLPAAIATVVLYIFSGLGIDALPAHDAPAAPAWLVLPYLIVIIAACAGVNVLLTLSLGIMAAMMAGAASGHGLVDMAGYLGAGIDSMGSLIVVTLLAAGLLGLIKWLGGIAFLLDRLTRFVSGVRGAQAAIAVLVGLVNLCTANNTVAIITVGSITRRISERYGVSPQKAASLLDSSACIVQCLIPYGAQALLAASLAGISPVAAIPYLYYPVLLALAVAVSIIFRLPRSARLR
ncbi:MAG: Na+/H+ antiporter NhaC family protein [Muribaculaceae bacterium]|nr:Na+/H+ antiporter NhaC family protein [Muribaculaceae bacterium]